MTEYKPWEGQKIEDAMPERKTTEVGEGVEALRGIRERMSKVLKKDQALKVSMHSIPQVERKEGDVWRDADGKKWTRKNGIIQSISPMQDARRPWFCPECEKVMRGKADDRMWLLRGKCHVCVIKEETAMRIAGTWEAYERQRIQANYLAQLRDSIEELKGYKDSIANPQIHFQDGRYEEWKVDSTALKTELQEVIDYLEIQYQELTHE